MDAPVWAGLVDGGSTTPVRSRFFRPRTEGQSETTSTDHRQVDGRSSNPLASSIPSTFAAYAESGPDIKPSLPSNEIRNTFQIPLIPTQPDIPQRESQPSAGAAPVQETPSIRPYVNLVVWETKYPHSAPHDYLILPTDDAGACRAKVSRLDDLLSTGHTLSAQLGQLHGAPSRYTPDMLAVEGMKPSEKQAWTWWARCEASVPGSGSSQLPPLDIERHRASVPVVAAGNKSNVAEKTPALELIYGLPTGTLSPEHVSYYLRPENASYFPILTAALRVLKARQHCSSSAGIGALFVDPRYKIEVEALKDFQRQLRARHTSLLVKGDAGLTWIEDIHSRVQSRIDWLEQASQPLRQKDIIKKQASQLQKPIWEP